MGTGHKSSAERSFPLLAWLPSVLIAILVEFLTGWSTPGQLVAQYIVQPHGLESIGPIFFTALAIDSALCLGIMLGMFVLGKVWNGVPEAKGKRGAATNWSNPQRTATITGAALCALPFSYYVVLGVAVSLNRGYFPASTWTRIGAFGVSFVACVIAIYVSFAVAVKVRLRQRVSRI